MTKLVIVYKATADLIPYAQNSRTHSAAQVNQIDASIEQFGFTNPILIDETGGVIAGHGRLLAANQRGMLEVPTITITGLTDAQRRAYVIADNRIALNSGWDYTLLAAELAYVQQAGNAVDNLGFSEDELFNIFNEVNQTGQAEGGGVVKPVTTSATREIDIDSFELAHKCPRCAFEFNDK
jgi:ParB-like nuclease domain